MVEWALKVEKGHEKGEVLIWGYQLLSSPNLLIVRGLIV